MVLWFYGLYSMHSTDNQISFYKNAEQLCVIMLHGCVVVFKEDLLLNGNIYLSNKEMYILILILERFIDFCCIFRVSTYLCV